MCMSSLVTGDIWMERIHRTGQYSTVCLDPTNLIGGDATTSPTIHKDKHVCHRDCSGNESIQAAADDKQNCHKSQQSELSEMKILEQSDCHVSQQSRHQIGIERRISSKSERQIFTTINTRSDRKNSSQHDQLVTFHNNLSIKLDPTSQR